MCVRTANKNTQFMYGHRYSNEHSRHVVATPRILTAIPY